MNLVRKSKPSGLLRGAGRLHCEWLVPMMVALSAIPAFAQNWPSFRGPNGAGVGTGEPPTKWNVKSGEHVKWKVRIPGLAHSSPIVWGDRIFLTTAVSDDEAEETVQTGWLQGTGDSAAETKPWTWKVICLDRKTGKTRWSRDAHHGVPKARRHIKATHANSTPATDGKHVVAFFGSEGLYCYSTKGKLLWKKDLGVLDIGPYNAPNMQWGAATSPIIYNNLVILQCDALNDSYWASFDIKTGEEKLRIPRGDVATWCTPTVARFKGGDPMLICNGWRKMAGYDLATGREIWTLSGGGDVPVPTPLVTKHNIILTNGHGRSPVYAIRPDATGDVTPANDEPGPGLAWYQPKTGSYMPTPVIVGSLLYVANDNGIICVREVKTGEEVYRDRIDTGGETFSASAVATKKAIYLTGEDGNIYVLKTGRKFKLLAKNAMGEVCMATPAISEGELFVRARKHLYCIAE